MNVWIVNPYGTLPSEGWREYRSSMLARALARRGHTSRWWISDIEHRSKQRRPIGVADPLLPPEVSVEIVPARSYRRNISLGRVRYERSFAAAFKRRSATLARPDLIVLADPSLFFAGPVLSYAKAHDVPLVVDILDLWPELFQLLLPKFVKPFGPTIFQPLYARRNRLLNASAAVVAVTNDYLEVAAAHVGTRPARTIYLGVDTGDFAPPSPAPIEGEPLRVIYAGTLGSAYDMATLVAAIERLNDSGSDIRFTIAGDGPWRERIQSLAVRRSGTVTFLGSIPAGDLKRHYAQAHVGLATYASGSTVSMPVKFYDYMAAGLATVGSMGGEARQLLESGIGQPYRAGNADDIIAQLHRYDRDRAALEGHRANAIALSQQFDQQRQHDDYATLMEAVAKAHANSILSAI